MRRAGFTLIEVLFVISLFAVLFLLLPGIEKAGLTRLTDQNEVQQMVDLLRWAQRRAITRGVRQYLTLDPAEDSYRIYELADEEEVPVREVRLTKIDLIGLNRSVPGMDHTFYYTPQGSSVFGCSIVLRDSRTQWKVVIAVGTGRIHIDKV